MMVFLFVLAVLVATIVLFLAARDWFEFVVIACLISLLYPFMTDAAPVVWLGCITGAILLTVVFVNRSRFDPVVVVVATVVSAVHQRLTPAFAGAWHWLTSGSPLKKSAVNRRSWR